MADETREPTAAPNEDRNGTFETDPPDWNDQASPDPEAERRTEQRDETTDGDGTV